MKVSRRSADSELVISKTHQGPIRRFQRAILIVASGVVAVGCVSTAFGDELSDVGEFGGSKFPSSTERREGPVEGLEDLISDHVSVDTLFTAVPASAFADAFLTYFRNAASTGPDRFGFDDEGQLVTSSRRVALLDYLNKEADRIGDELVADLSEALANDPATTLSERIVALRNVTVRSNSGKASLAKHLREILEVPGIAEREPFAFLQVLNGIVFLGDAEFLPRLEEMARDERNSSSVILAMHLLAQNAPLLIAEALNENPGLLDDLPAVRADLLANLNPGSEMDQRALTAYLLRADVDTEEKQRLLRRLRQPAFVLADGIFTGRGEIVNVPDDRDSQLRSLFDRWLLSEEIRPTLAPFRK